jgi:uncharacterized protein (TIGR03663 family)
MTSRFSLTLESALYLALAGLALAIRLYALGGQPLTDREAHDALSAYRFLQGDASPAAAEAEPQPLPASPLLFSLTSLAFLLFGASDAVARLAPALAGSALVLTPAYYRRELGSVAALGAAALIAVSPTLIAASRSADAVMLVALAVAATAGSLVEYSHTGNQRHLYMTAVGAGAALAGGPRTFTLLIGLALAALLWRLLDAEGSSAWLERLRSGRPTGETAGRMLALAAGILVATSSALLVYRPGLAAAAQAVPAWLAGWAPPVTGWPWLQAPAILLVYEPFTLFLGVAGLVYVARRWAAKDRFAWALAAWSLGALVAGMVYPGSTSEEVVWVVLPLAGLGSLLVVELASGAWAEIDAAAVAIHAALVLLLVTYSGLNIAAFGQADRALVGTAAANLGLAAVSLGLVILISLLFGVGWSAGTALRGFAFGLGIALLFASASAAGRLVSWGENSEMAGELWHGGAPTPLTGLRLMTSTLEDVSGRAVGAPHDLDVVVNGPPTGALAWALRDFHDIAFTGSLAASITAPAVIAPADQTTPELGSAYVGQSFAVRGWLDLASRAPLDWLSWLAFRRQPTQMESVVLWVRSDVQFMTGEGLAQ